MVGKAGTRRFEYKNEKSSKFWEISVADKGFTVRCGKIGTDGQTQIKEFADAATAEKQALPGPRNPLFHPLNSHDLETRSP